MPCIVADTSPLFYLAALGRLSLLRQLYGRLTVPDSVWAEALVGDSEIPNTKPALEAARESGWIIIRPCVPPLMDLRLADLDAGERDALTLAVTLRADLVIIDELEGRAEAVRLGLTITGTVGVLIEAKRRGLLPAIGPELKRLQDETTFWLSRHMEQTALRLADEAAPPKPLP